jgi:ubiquinone/menaquinone biosynthesis C-methylase UbiE
VPSKKYLSELLSQQTNNIWSDECYFRLEKGLIESLMAKPAFDLLDVGPAHGGLLKACNDSKGRRSGLDIVQHTGVDAYLRGEFIQGLLEEPTLVWQNEPYDIVTAFDVFEHLYHPTLAFTNLSRLVKKKGFVVLETGDVHSFWPSKFGVHEWWYVNLLEHHVFWSEHSLNILAHQNGFKVISFTRKRHKSRPYLPFLNAIIATLKSNLYYLSPNNYKRVVTVLGKSRIQPFCVFTKDHFQAILKKI